jgi:hypothetical protein
MSDSKSHYVTLQESKVKRRGLRLKEQERPIAYLGITRRMFFVNPNYGGGEKIEKEHWI